MKKIIMLLIPIVLLLSSCGDQAVLTVCASGDVSLAYTDSGTVFVWGGIAFEPSVSPSELDTDGEVVEMVSGDGFVLWRTPHALYGAGRRDLLPLGDSSTDRAEATLLLSEEYSGLLAGISPIIQMAAGASFTLALKEDGTVRAWGFNNYEQLGAAAVGTASYTPLKIERLSGIRRIAASGRLAAAVDMDGNVWTWGGTPFDSHGSRVPPEVVVGLPEIVEIYVSDTGYAALDREGNVWIWDADIAQPLTSSWSPHTTPHLAPLPGVSVAALCGDGTIAAIDSAKQLWLLQRGSAESEIALTDIVQITAGNAHVLALKADGSLWAWGDNGSGQLGTGSTDSASEFVRVSVK